MKANEMFIKWSPSYCISGRYSFFCFHYETFDLVLPYCNWNKNVKFYKIVG